MTGVRSLIPRVTDLTYTAPQRHKTILKFTNSVKSEKSLSLYIIASLHSDCKNDGGPQKCWCYALYLLCK